MTEKIFKTSRDQKHGVKLRMTAPFSSTMQMKDSSEKCKIKQQWSIISHLSEWLSSINQQTSAGEDVEKGEHFCTVGGNADWCSHCGK